MAENKTTLGVQFFKGWYGKGNSKSLPATTGAIIFNEEEQIIYVNGKPYGGASSVSFNDGVLTITYSDGRPTQTLDFRDTASATATLKVFDRIDNLIGPNINVENGDGKLNYTGTSYLSEQGTEGTEGYRAAAATLVEADKRLDTAIKAVDTRIDNMDVASNTVDGTNVHIKYKQEDGKVTVESVTEDYATLTETKYKKAEGEQTLVNPALVVKEGDDSKLLKASDVATIAEYTDDKVAQLKDEVNSQVDGLHVDDYAQATYDVTGNIVIKGIQENNGLISATDDDTKNFTIKVNHTYAADAIETDLATVKTVKDAIETLDTTADVQAVTLTEANEITGAKLVFNGVKEENGIIKAGELTNELQLAKVATSGEAKDVTTTGIGAHTTGEGEEATTTYDIAAGNVQGVLETLNTKINNLDASSALTLKKVNGDTEETAKAVTADGSEYKLYQGTDVVAKFNIEKDSFVKTGEVVKGFLNGGVFKKDDNGEYFIHLVINTHDADTDATAEKDVYISAKSLVDVYTANNGTDNANNVTITVDNTNNTISAVIKAAGVGTNELANGAVTFAKIASDNVENGTTTSTKLTTKSYVDEKVSTVVDGLDADFTNTSATEGGSDKRAKDAKSNVAVSLKEENGVVTTLGVDATYATIASSKEEGKDTTLTGTDGTGLLIGTDVATIATFANTRIAEEVSKLDATVASETSPVLTTIVETDGKLTSVSNRVLGANVSYTEATETKEANLTATDTTGVVLGSDITNIKQYIDAKAAKGTTVVKADSETAGEESIKVTSSTLADGHTEYTVSLVWKEWEDKSQE